MLALANDDNLLAVTLAVGNTFTLSCIDAATGLIRWNAALDCSTDCQFQFAVSQDIAILLSFEQFEHKALISCWIIATGERIWEQPLAQDFELRLGNVLCMDTDRVYVGGKSSVVAFNLNGEVLWTAELPKNVGDLKCCGLSLDGKGNMLVSLGVGGLLCIGCDNGSKQWHNASNTVFYPCVIGRANIVFACLGERPAAFDIRDGSPIWGMALSDSQKCDRILCVSERGLVVKTQQCSITLLNTTSGAVFGEIGLRSDLCVLTKDGMLCCIGTSVWSPFSLGDALFCIDISVGRPDGPWPMDRQSASGGAYLETELQEGYKQFIQAWKARENMLPRLARLAEVLEDEKANTARIHGIVRGHEMVAQAKLWAEPLIGSSKIAPVRGAQWRLVMAFGGFELLAKSLLSTSAGGLNERDLKPLIGKLNLLPLNALTPPSIEKASLKEWMNDEDAGDVLDFLKMENGDRKRFDNWLARQQPVATWTDAILLAKVFRSATVHGALSPSKILEWRLGEAVSQLTNAIFQIEEAVFEVLGRNQS